MPKPSSLPDSTERGNIVDNDWLRQLKISWPIFLVVITVGGGFVWKVSKDYTSVTKDIEYTREQLNEIKTAVQSLQMETVEQLHKLDKRVDRLERPASSDE